jgi:hypothetical protein
MRTYWFCSPTVASIVSGGIVLGFSVAAAYHARATRTPVVSAVEEENVRLKQQVENMQVDLDHISNTVNKLLDAFPVVTQGMCSAFFPV